MSVRLSKEESEKLLVERRDTVRKVCLKKQDLSHLRSRVALALDVSGSMREAFESGMVQATLERLLPLAMAFDDDGSMEVWTFNGSFRRYPSITKKNFYDYVKQCEMTYGGETKYAPVIAHVGEYFIKKEPANLPTYVIFITDGDNCDQAQTDTAIKAISHFPIFFQFVGIGDTGARAFKYLRKLDDMNGRYVDNANFFAIETLADIDLISDTELYMKLLDEYPKWLNYPQVKKMIANVDKLAKTNKKWMKKLENTVAEKRSDLDSADLILGIVEMILDLLGG